MVAMWDGTKAATTALQWAHSWVGSRVDLMVDSRDLTKAAYLEHYSVD